MQNPFTTTFSKAPEHTYIATPRISEILENFSYESPSESVYKITGVRGSGKTVILSKVEESLRSEENKAKGWIVLDLNPARDLLGQIAAMLHGKGFGSSDTKNMSVNISATVLGSGGGFGYSAGKENDYFDIGAEIETMIRQVQEKGQKILIGIDEVSRTQGMVVFASEYGRWLRANYPVCLICTGLYENMQEVSNVKNITFFQRATTIKTEPLDMSKMSEVYQSQLNIESSEAEEMARCTKGYAYAFQELGVLYFKKRADERLGDIIPELKSELFAYSYEKIWEEMSEADRFLASLLTDKEEYEKEEVLRKMGDKADNYPMYRDRLVKRGILESRDTRVSLALPYFADYIKEYCR